MIKLIPISVVCFTFTYCTHSTEYNNTNDNYYALLINKNKIDSVILTKDYLKYIQRNTNTGESRIFSYSPYVKNDSMWDAKAQYTDTEVDLNTEFRDTLHFQRFNDSVIVRSNNLNRMGIIDFVLYNK